MASTCIHAELYSDVFCKQKLDAIRAQVSICQSDECDVKITTCHSEVCHRSLQIWNPTCCPEINPENNKLILARSSFLGLKSYLSWLEASWLHRSSLQQTLLKSITGDSDIMRAVLRSFSCQIVHSLYLFFFLSWQQ